MKIYPDPNDIPVYLEGEGNEEISVEVSQIYQNVSSVSEKDCPLFKAAQKQREDQLVTEMADIKRQEIQLYLLVALISGILLGGLYLFIIL